MISKLMTKASAKKEYAFKSIFEPIDPRQEYFYYPEAMCTPDLTSNPENNISSCRVELGDPALLLSRDGGVDLSHINVEYRELAAFLESLTTLFDGLALLHRNGVVHLDIKPLNVVSRMNADGTFTTRYIDFGLSSTVARAIAEARTDNYAYWPFDLRLLSNEYMTGFRRPSNKAIRGFYTELAYNTPIFPVWLYSLPNGFPITESWAELLLGKIRGRVISKERVATGVDVFALGRTLAEVYTNLTHHYYVEDKTTNVRQGMIGIKLPSPPRTEEVRNFNTELAKRVTLPIYALVADMIDPNPDKRITAEEAATRYRDLVPVIREVLHKWYPPHPHRAPPPPPVSVAAGSAPFAKPAYPKPADIPLPSSPAPANQLPYQPSAVSLDQKPLLAPPPSRS
jgi:serine/threonine protein kinase